MQAGLVVVDDGPTVFALDSLTAVGIAVSAAAGQVSVTFDDTDAWPDEDGAGLLVYLSRQKGPAIEFFKGPYRLAGIIPGDGVTAPTSPDTSLTAPFEMTSGNSSFARVLSCRADGRISAVQFSGPTQIVA
jgi:hypothetical protein